MRIAYIDGGAGMSGDMTLGALVHAGWDFNELAEIPEALGLAGVNVVRTSLNKKGIMGTKIDVQIPHEHSHRHLSDIIRRIEGSKLEEETKRRACRVFQRIARAEAEVHGVDVEEIHFHEVGAVDAMVDVVGACRGFVRLGIERVVLSPLRLGSGYVNCAHGRLPVPAPATALLLQGIPCFAGDAAGEWTTPTGAALAAEWADEYGVMPQMTIGSVGWGAGQADPDFPNALRIIVGELLPRPIDQSENNIYILETEIDDMQGEIYTYLGQLLAEISVKDYFITPIIMKKGRPGQLISVLVSRNDIDRTVKTLFRETTTFGIRIRESERFCLERRFVETCVSGEPIRVKIGEWEGQVLRISPEFEDCRSAAEKLGISLDSIYQSAKEEAKKLLKTEGF